MTVERLSQHDRERVDEIMGGYGDWFSAKLLRLIAKADSGNRELLRSVFPDHVRAYEDWFYGRTSVTTEEGRS